MEFGNGEVGGLISLRTTADGGLVVDVYCVDEGVEIRAPLTRMKGVAAALVPNSAR